MAMGAETFWSPIDLIGLTRTDKPEGRCGVESLFADWAGTSKMVLGLSGLFRYNAVEEI